MPNVPRLQYGTRPGTWIGRLLGDGTGWGNPLHCGEMGDSEEAGCGWEVAAWGSGLDWGDGA